MDEDQRFQIVLKNEFPVNNHAYLFMLYRPLIGSQASVLYETLLALSQYDKPEKMDLLCEMAGLDAVQFEQARNALEAFLLVNTVYLQEDSLYKMYLFPCKAPRDFLNDEIFARLLSQTISNEHFKKLVELYAPNEDHLAEPVDVSRKISLSDLERNWNPQKEEFFQNNRPKTDLSLPKGFEWDLFFSGLDRIFPLRLRSRENLARIARLANFYGLDEKEIKKQIPSVLDKNKTEINFEMLEQRLMYMRPENPVNPQDPYQLSPIQFLRRLSPDEVQILSSEKKMLRDFYEDMGFSFEVINTLIEYGLKECDQQISEKFLRKVANTWKRKNVQNRQQALEQIRQDNRAKKPFKRRKLPDYYTYVPSSEQDPELLAAALKAEEEFNKL